MYNGSVCRKAEVIDSNSGHIFRVNILNKSYSDAVFTMLIYSFYKLFSCLNESIKICF